MENFDWFLALTAEDQRHELFSGQFDVLNLLEHTQEEKGAIIAIEGYESWQKKNNKLQIPFSSQTSRVSDIVDDNR